MALYSRLHRALLSEFSAGEAEALLAGALRKLGIERDTLGPAQAPALLETLRPALGDLPLWPQLTALAVPGTDLPGTGDPAAGEDFGGDDFEFEDPEHAVFASDVRVYDLADAAEQDRLLVDLARNEGVLGALLCDARGQPLRMRLPRGGEEIARVAAVTAQMLKRPWRLLTMQLGEQHLSVRPLGEHMVAVVSEGANLGRLLAELQLIRSHPGGRA